MAQLGRATLPTQLDAEDFVFSADLANQGLQGAAILQLISFQGKRGHFGSKISCVSALRKNFGFHTKGGTFDSDRTTFLFAAV